MVKLGIEKLRRELRSLRDPKKAQFLQRYFKTGKGQYAEGDEFLGGIDTPTARKLQKKYQELSVSDTQKLLKSKYHEERNIALGILGYYYQKADKKGKLRIYKFYLKNTRYINNWDLVDTSAHRIVGNYLLENPKEEKLLNKLARSKSLWERRIAIISTFAFVAKGNLEKSLEIAEILLNDNEDLIHKAVGWVLREVGKKDRATEEAFLKKNYKIMPRTMLRYSIERFPEGLRKKYLIGDIQ